MPNADAARREFVGLHSELTGRIIAAFRQVHASLGAGFLEKVYENALCIELRGAGLEVRQQCPVEVYYRGSLVGNFIADLIVEGAVIVEVKAVDALSSAHEIQVVNYLRATTLEVGLLVNFRHALQFRRLILTNDHKDLPTTGSNTMSSPFPRSD